MKKRLFIALFLVAGVSLLVVVPAFAQGVDPGPGDPFGDFFSGVEGVLGVWLTAFIFGAVPFALGFGWEFGWEVVSYVLFIGLPKVFGSAPAPGKPPGWFYNIMQNLKGLQPIFVLVGGAYFSWRLGLDVFEALPFIFPGTQSLIDQAQGFTQTITQFLPGLTAIWFHPRAQALRAQAGSLVLTKPRP